MMIEDEGVEKTNIKQQGIKMMSSGELLSILLPVG